MIVLVLLVLLRYVDALPLKLMYFLRVGLIYLLNVALQLSNLLLQLLLLSLKRSNLMTEFVSLTRVIGAEDTNICFVVRG